MRSLHSFVKKRRHKLHQHEIGAALLLLRVLYVRVVCECPSFMLLQLCKLQNELLVFMSEWCLTIVQA